MPSQLACFVSGGAGGVALLLVGQPFDTLKVRMQTNPALYPTISTTIRHTLSKEGPRAFYKGTGAMLPVITPLMACQFTGYEQGKRIFGDQTLSQLALAGLFASCYTTPIYGPSERIKCIAQTTTRYGTNSVEIAKNVLKEGGARTLLRGFGMTFARESIGCASYYSTYALIKMNCEKNGKFGVKENIFAGGMAGVMMWILACPADVMKSRIQIEPMSKPTGQILSEIKTDVRKNGIGVLYRGIGPTLMRAFPANAACFLGYEQAMKVVEKYV